MSTISDSRSRWLASMLTVLGGSVLLSACSPAAPSAPDVVAVRGDGEAGDGRVSAQTADMLWCFLRPCTLIDPVDVTGGTDPFVHVSLNMTNVAVRPGGHCTRDGCPARSGRAAHTRE